MSCLKVAFSAQKQVQAIVRHSNGRLKRIMSGIQPTGEAHLGNYLGALRNWAQLSSACDSSSKMLCCIVDLHALTSVRRDSDTDLMDATLNMAATLVGCGLSLESSLIYPQSMVAAHCELMWLLSCHSAVGALTRLPQYVEKGKQLAKSKPKKGGEAHGNSRSCGLLTYPILQSADILLFDAELVPVGDDQTVHVNLTRDLVHSINALYANGSAHVEEKTHSDETNEISADFAGVGKSEQLLADGFTKHSAIDFLDDCVNFDGRELDAVERSGRVLVKPLALVNESCPRVMSLRMPTHKMSKSDASAKSRIELTDSADVISDKVKGAVTDSLGPGLSYDLEQRPGVANLIRIYAALNDCTVDEVLQQMNGRDTVYFKRICAEAIIEHLSPLRAEIMRLRADKHYLHQMLVQNAAEADAIAQVTLNRVKRAMKLIR